MWEGWLRRGGWLGHRLGLVGNGERLQNDGLGGEAPGARRVDRRQAKLLAHVHPAIEAERDIERVEDEIARARVEVAELGREPTRQALAQQPAELSNAQAHGRGDAAHAFGEVPYRQPFLEQLRAVGHQKLDAIGEWCCGIHRAVEVEGTAHSQVERSGVEIGQAGEVLEERAARHTGDGGDGGRGWFNVTGLNEVQRRLDKRLPGSQTAYDAAILRTRNINWESDNFHIETNRIRISLMSIL